MVHSQILSVAIAKEKSEPDVKERIEIKITNAIPILESIAISLNSRCTTSMSFIARAKHAIEKSIRVFILETPFDSIYKELGLVLLFFMK